MTDRPTTESAARTLVIDVLGTIAPGPALDALGPREDLRETLGLDSLDFLKLVAQVSKRTGLRIDEDDYDQLTDLDGWAVMLIQRGAEPAQR